MPNFYKHLAIATVTVGIFACSQKPAPSEPASKPHSSPHGQQTSQQVNTTSRDTVLRDTTRILGTPGSPTGAESRGMPGEKPIPKKK